MHKLARRAGILARSIVRKTAGARTFLPSFLPLTVVALLLTWLAIPARGAETDVVINEVMYHPPFDMDEMQWIELYNHGDAEVDLSRWSLAKGVEFTFPAQTRLGAGAYLVVCRDRNIFAANYPTNIPITGNFTNRLSHRADKIELCDPAGKVIDSLKYNDQEPWPRGPDGRSASLERISPFVSGKEPANWAGSTLPVTEKFAGTPGRKNDNYAKDLPPVISKVAFKTPAPRQQATVSAEVSAGAGVRSVALLWRIAGTGGETAENEVPMQRISGDENQGTYQAVIEGKPAGSLVRFRIKAVSRQGSFRLLPSPNEPRPTYSYCTLANTNTARVGFAFAMHISEQHPERRIRVWNGRSFSVTASPVRGNGAFIYMPAGGGEVQTFDHVYVRPRKGGFKVHFAKDQTFKGMTGINVIFENSPRWLLSEPMAYELYRLAGTPACLTEHVRTWVDGQLIGYQLLIEQPNKAFLNRNSRDDTGYMYKVTYMGQGLVGQHMKRTRLATGYEDLMALYQGLTGSSGTEQWNFIQKNFNIEEFANYYAVNMCIQNWDGFFNNYWLYHDSGKTKKWEMYPWDEDKTWGDYDGASPEYDWYTMPLTFGMSDGRATSPEMGFGWGGGGWWRPPGWFSGPLLANREFRKVFLTRLGEICTNYFTEEKMFPLIDAMEKRLEPEIVLRGRLFGQNPRAALDEFYHDTQSLRNQVKFRRQFILQQIPKDRAAR